MRIIAGSAKGRRLASPKTRLIRPVLDQVKEAIFNILFDVRGLRVLDLFAGTGSVGLEALSRGAAEVVFVDNGREAVSLIQENIKKCGFEENCRVISLHVDSALKLLAKDGKKFDLIFVDPPYLKDLINTTIKKIAKFELLSKTGMIITEHHPKEGVQELADGLAISDERKYGQTIITFLHLVPGTK